MVKNHEDSSEISNDSESVQINKKISKNNSNN